MYWTGEEPDLTESGVMWPYPPKVEERDDLIHPFTD